MENKIDEKTKEIIRVIKSILKGSGKSIDLNTQKEMVLTWKDSLDSIQVPTEDIFPLYHFALEKKQDWNAFGVQDLLRSWTDYNKQKQLSKPRFTVCARCSGEGIDNIFNKICIICNGSGFNYTFNTEQLDKLYTHMVKSDNITDRCLMPKGKFQGMRLSVIKKFFPLQYRELKDNISLETMYPKIHEFIKKDL